MKIKYTNFNRAMHALAQDLTSLSGREFTFTANARRGVRTDSPPGTGRVKSGLTWFWLSLSRDAQRIEIHADYDPATEEFGSPPEHRGKEIITLTAEKDTAAIAREILRRLLPAQHREVAWRNERMIEAEHWANRMQASAQMLCDYSGGVFELAPTTEQLPKRRWIHATSARARSNMRGAIRVGWKDYSVALEGLTEGEVRAMLRALKEEHDTVYGVLK